MALLQLAHIMSWFLFLQLHLLGTVLFIQAWSRKVESAHLKRSAFEICVSVCPQCFSGLVTYVLKSDWQEGKHKNSLEEKWRNTSCWESKMEKRVNEIRLFHCAKVFLLVTPINGKSSSVLCRNLNDKSELKVRKSIKLSVDGCYCHFLKKKWMLIIRIITL